MSQIADVLQNRKIHLITKQERSFKNFQQVKIKIKNIETLLPNTHCEVAEDSHDLSRDGFLLLVTRDSKLLFCF